MTRGRCGSLCLHSNWTCTIYSLPISRRTTLNFRFLRYPLTCKFCDNPYSSRLGQTRVAEVGRRRRALLLYVLRRIRGSFRFQASSWQQVCATRSPLVTASSSGLPKKESFTLGILMPGVVPDMPGLRRGELRIARSEARFSHLARAEIDGISKDRGQQRYPVLCGIPALQVSEVPDESCVAECYIVSRPV